jgi:DNA polymerase-4
MPGVPAPRCILHADMDAFYAAIEQRDDPALRGRPVVVGGLGKRGVVSTASYEARRFGIHSALPTAIARVRCPDAVYLPPRMEHYVAESERVFAVFARYTPLVEPLSLDEAFLDVGDSRAAFGDGPAIARRIQEEIEREIGLTVSIGVAGCKYVAKVASDLQKPRGLVVVEAGSERAFLAPLPVRRLFGAGPATAGRLGAAGFATIADVQRASRPALAAAVGGALAEHFLALAQGVDPRPVEPAREAQSVGAETTFEDDVTDEAECVRVLLELSERVGRRLRRAALRGRVVKLKIRFPPFETHTRQKALAAATADDLEIHQTARALLVAARDGRPVRLLGVSVSALRRATAPVQAELFAARPPAAARLQQAIDRIRDKFGDDAIGRLPGGRAEPTP